MILYSAFGVEKTSQNRKTQNSWDFFFLCDMSEKIEERIKELEERMAATQVNKHTQKSINYLRAQIAKLRDQLVTIASSKKGGGTGFGVKKTGDAQVAFIGFPSVGKSSLLNLLTEGRTDSRVAAYDFTTLTAIPGMMEILRAKIQLIDLPGIILGAATGKGRGKEILGILCKRLHRSFMDQFRYALIWGKKVKHPGQKFQSLDQTLEDGDIVSIYIKR
jgi:ribosome-interacting GTPase 1